MTQDLRYKALSNWLQQQTGFEQAQLSPVNADASFRRYFRTYNHHNDSYMLMDAPPTQEPLTAFITIATYMTEAGLNAPQIFAQDIEQGFLLLSDLGDDLYLNQLQTNNDNERLYGDALSALTVMQTCIDTDDLPIYDKALLQHELQLFPDWYLKQHINYQLDHDQQTGLEQTFELLISNACEQPQVFVHRDYHSRNLLKTVHNPGIIDFQDAVCGPITYDLVSLLRDAYITLNPSIIDEYVKGYYKLARQSGLLTEQQTETQFIKWFDLMGLQRHLKVIGIFARLAYRDQKKQYLQAIPTVYAYLLDISNKYPETQALHQLLQTLPRTP